VFVHTDLSIIVAYVDDLLMVADPSVEAQHWKSIDEAIEFKEGLEPIGRYLGANYTLSPFVATRPDEARVLKISMKEYSINAASRFQDELVGRLPKVTSPFLTDKEWGNADDRTGVFSSTCASHVATYLFLGRVGRPDISVPVQRLCRNVSKWTVIDDWALTRLSAYLLHNADVHLYLSLSPLDLWDLVIRLYTDADWNGDASTTKSTNGCWLELYSPASGNTWAIAWSSTLQTSTSSSTCEAETVAMSKGLRTEALPVQDLMEQFLGQRLDVVCHVDNTQAITAAKKGYSKKLRALPRTHRVSLGVVHECVSDQRMSVDVVHCGTLDMKGDMFTKALSPAPFLRMREMCGILSDAPQHLHQVPY